MAEKARIGFSLDLGDTKTQLNDILKGLKDVKSGFKKTGTEGSASVNKLNLGLKSVFKNISTLSTGLRKTLAEGSRLSRKQLNELLNKSKTLEERLGQIHAKTAAKVEQAEGRKRKALNATLKVQGKAIRGVQKLGSETTKSVKDIEKAFLVLESVATVKLASVFKSLIKEATILAARNQVLGTAMRTVGNNAGITNAELTRSENTIRKLGISINDTRELISRFSQAQLGMENATRLARAAQDLAAGSTLGSSEALRIMTQSILSLLPRQLRQFGVVVNLNQVYKEQSKILGKSVLDLTAMEKRQGLLNNIFQEAAKRAGAYERSMQDAGKVMTTLSSRIIPDTLSMFGDEFLPVFNKLIFAFKDLLEWLQKLPSGVKTFIASLVAAVTAILAVKAALILLGGTLGFVKAGFAGAAVSAATASAAMNPYIIAVGLLAAALVILPKLFKDSASAQEQMLKASQGVLDVESDRLKQLTDLKKVVENQALSERDLKKILETNISRHKELIPLLSKEVVTREDILAILDKEIVKRKEVVDITLKQTQKLNKEQIQALKDEQKNVGNLIVSLTKLQERYGEGKVPILTLTSALSSFEDEVESSGRSVNNLGDHMREFADENDEGLDVLKRSYADLGAKIKNAMEEGEQSFGLAAKGIVKNAKDMEQAFLGLDARLDKLAAKTLKKFPFQAIIKEQQKFTEALDKAVLTDERRSEVELKLQQVFQDRFTAAEIKFREKLESIGVTDLQKIEAKRKKEVEINQGSVIAIQAIEKQAAFARNEVFVKMWDDRLQLTQESTNAILNVIRIERDLALQQAQRDVDTRIAGERLGADEIVQIRIEGRERALQIIKTSQDEEFSVRKQHFVAVAEQLTILFNTGIINEQQFNERSKALALDLRNFRQAQLDERITNLKSSLDQLIAAETGATARIKALEEEKAAAVRSTEAIVRQLRQQGQSDIKNFNDDRERAEQLLAEGETAIRENNFDRAKEISNEIKSLALATSKEVRESGKKDSEVLISADKARIGSIKLVEEAGALLQRSFETQRAAEVSALDKVKDKISEIETAIKLLTSEKKEIEVELKDEASKQIDEIKKKLDGLKDKTITITVMTRNIAVGGGTGEGAATGGAEAAVGGPVLPVGGDTGFAEGAIDIQGSGTQVSDSIVAMLSRGESVVTAAATQMFKPLLELMNADPEKLRQVLVSRIKAGAVGGGTSVSNTSTKFGDIAININGVAPEDVRNINWRKTVREEIWPELKRFKERKTFI